MDEIDGWWCHRSEAEHRYGKTLAVGASVAILTVGGLFYGLLARREEQQVGADIRKERIEAEVDQDTRR